MSDPAPDSAAASADKPAIEIARPQDTNFMMPGSDVEPFQAVFGFNDFADWIAIEETLRRVSPERAKCIRNPAVLRFDNYKDETPQQPPFVKFPYRFGLVFTVHLREEPIEVFSGHKTYDFHRIVNQHTHITLFQGPDPEDKSDRPRLIHCVKWYVDSQAKDRAESIRTAVPFFLAEWKTRAELANEKPTLNEAETRKAVAKLEKLIRAHEAKRKAQVRAKKAPESPVSVEEEDDDEKDIEQGRVAKPPTRIVVEPPAARVEPPTRVPVEHVEIPLPEEEH